MTRPTSPRTRLLFFLISVILFILLIPIVVLYSAGYRLGKDLSLEPTGGIYVYYPEAGVNVNIIGQPLERTSRFTRSVFVQNLAPGIYEIRVGKEGYTEWQKKVLVVERRVAEGYPFLILDPIATTTVPVQIRRNVELLFSATNRMKTTLSVDKALGQLGTTTSSSTIINNQGILSKDMYLYKEDNNLVALWKGETSNIPLYFCAEITKLCDPSIVITESSSPIKHFDFFPGRNDVVVYSNADGIFVTELDMRPPHNYVTLALGNLDFRINGDHIYIKDKNIIYELVYGK
jgi:hypothetical protein